MFCVCLELEKHPLETRLIFSLGFENTVEGRYNANQYKMFYIKRRVNLEPQNLLKTSPHYITRVEFGAHFS